MSNYSIAKIFLLRDYIFPVCALKAPNNTTWCSTIVVPSHRSEKVRLQMYDTWLLAFGRVPASYKSDETAYCHNGKRASITRPIQFPKHSLDLYFLAHF